MIFKFKLIPSEKESKIMGMFGDCIKIRVQINYKTQITRIFEGANYANEQLSGGEGLDNTLTRPHVNELTMLFKTFISHELGIQPEQVEIVSISKKNFVEVELPDLAYEIIMSYLS
jgi:hypothetical protein